MKHLSYKTKLIMSVLIAVSVITAGCGASGDGGGTDTGGKYEIPEFRDVSFDEASAEGEEVRTDISHSSQGYFAVLSESDARIKLQVNRDDDSYIYDVPSGSPQFFPFSLGDGDYHIRVMKNTDGDRYAELYSVDASVKLDSEFEPFLRSNQYAPYTEGSACVKKARELAESSSGETDFISKVYEYICSDVSYDKEKAAGIQSGYLPDPDAVMASGKGICFDYASLAAAMLRSQGIPVKIIFGYVGSDMDLYHAWNMYYTEESGWVSVGFEADPEDWNRMDLTFSANGEDSDFIGDGSNYTDVFTY